MTEEQIKIDNKIRSARSQNARWFDSHPQEKFNLYVDTIVAAYDTSVEWVLSQAIVKDYGKELGVEYTGKW